MAFPLPANEVARKSAVEAYGIYGTEAELAFDDLTELAAQITGAPIALVNIVGDERVWLKSAHGVPPELNEVPRGAVCCAHAICQSDLFCIADTHADERFKDLPFIATEPFVRFYAGMPLIDPGGYALGTLCIMGLEPRHIDFQAAEAVRRLARQAVAQLDLRLSLARMRQANAAIEEAKARSEKLILNILPKKIADELADTGAVEPRHHAAVSIVFTDFVGFTRSAEKAAPRALIDDLHAFFSGFDDIFSRHGVEKLKTIGDAYMAVGGLLDNKRDHPVRACLAALEVLAHVEALNDRRQRLSLEPWELRVGVPTGAVMSGVVGKSKFTYDIWGDAVNIAARIEASGARGRLNVSEDTYERVKDYFVCEPRGVAEIKNKGEARMFFVSGLKPEYAADATGWQPNEKLKNAVSNVTPGWSLT